MHKFGKHECPLGKWRNAIRNNIVCMNLKCWCNTVYAIVFFFICCFAYNLTLRHKSTCIVTRICAIFIKWCRHLYQFWSDDGWDISWCFTEKAVPVCCPTEEADEQYMFELLALLDPGLVKCQDMRRHVVAQHWSNLSTAYLADRPCDSSKRR